MRKLPIVAMIMLATGFAGVGPSFAGSGSGGSGGGGMGDPSARMRYQQEICDEQRRGEYPRDHDACLPDSQPQTYQR